MMGLTGGRVLRAGSYSDKFDQAQAVVLDRVACKGTEADLAACTYSADPGQACTHAQDVALECTGRLWSSAMAVVVTRHRSGSLPAQQPAVLPPAPTAVTWPGSSRSSNEHSQLGGA